MPEETLETQVPNEMGMPVAESLGCKTCRNLANGACTKGHKKNSFLPCKGDYEADPLKVKEDRPIPIFKPDQYEREIRVKKKINAISLYDLWVKETKQIKYLIEKIIQEDAMQLFVGPGGSFKTGILIHIALCGATGLPVMGEFEVTEKFNTLFLDEENGEPGTKENAIRIARGMGLERGEWAKHVFFECIEGFLIKGDWIEALKDYIIEHEIRLVVIDNIARTLVGSEQDAENVKQVHALLKPLSVNQHCTFALIHHTNKAAWEQRQVGKKKTRLLSTDVIRGSTDFPNQSDIVWYLEEFYSMKDGTTLFNMAQIKKKYGQKMPPFSFSIIGNFENKDPLVIKYRGEIAKLTGTKRQKAVMWLIPNIIGWLKEYGAKGKTTKEIKSQFEGKKFDDDKGKTIKISERDIDEAIGEFKDNPRVECFKNGHFAFVPDKHKGRK